MLAPVISYAQSSMVSPPVTIWPNGAPGGAANNLPEKDNTKPSDNRVGNKTVIRITNVSSPTITVYAPAKEPTSARGLSTR